MDRFIDLEITPSARWAIADQGDYFALKAGDRLLEQWERAIQDMIASLLLFPEQGSLCYFPNLKVEGLRRISVTGFPKHLLFYRYSQLTNSLLILHMAHGASDLEASMAKFLTNE